MKNSKAQKLAGTKPNIILVMTDDQGSNLSYMGHPYVKTPHIDAFAKKAIRFNEFHVSPTCAPTRAAIMSGRHEFRNGVTHTIHERELMALSTTTFPELLRTEGYETGIFGKWHLGDIDEYLPGNRGFSEALTHGAGGIGQLYPGSCADFPPNTKSKNKYFDNVLLHNETIVQTKGYCTDLFFDAALGWMKKNIEEKKPFFTYISTNTPHSPLIAPDAKVNALKKRFPDLAKPIINRFGMIENIDDNFGELIAKLTAWGVLENTLIIFTTDNGAQVKDGKEKTPWNNNFRTGKGSPGEGGTHVPCFWYWKGSLQENKEVKALTAHIDLYKTFCDLAGVRIPNTIQKIDGRSLLPVLKNPDVLWEDDRMLFINSGRWAKGTAPVKEGRWGIRSQKWRLVQGKLYDIENDAKETKNVAKEYPKVFEKMKKEYSIWWEETMPLMINENREYGGVEPPLVTRYKKQKASQGIPNWSPLPIKD
ncbi:arylsulfatase [Flavicella sediminum]|uniref:arylsulfatase n=1 Tax=Flavicella sediminum TaxID=2585141 RepID=UPI001AA0128D|nr:arylsulfatase [Flavicella sediminum]